MDTWAILKCTCRHVAQDGFYGTGKRLHTWSTKRNQWRCTVCLSMKGGTVEAK